jgi:hypothetical protein
VVISDLKLVIGDLTRVKVVETQPVQLWTTPYEVVVVLILYPSQATAPDSSYQAENRPDPNPISSSFRPMQHSQPCDFHHRFQSGKHR